MIDCCIDLLAILAPFREPSWSHVAHFSKKLWRSKLPPPTFLLRWRFFVFFRRLDPILAPFRGLWAPSWFDFGGFWPHLGPILAPLLREASRINSVDVTTWTWASCGNSVLNSWKKSGIGSAASKLMSATPKDSRVLYWIEKISIHDHFSIV